ncbi:MAG TPA: SHOCT domain-containing protein [Paludibacter sp.]|nr:SHOCT domain-containing protein [Paludibacter sp.]
MAFYRNGLLLFILFLFFCGCAAPQQIMINPTTKHQINCASMGIGIIGTTAALATYYDCKNKYTALGYIPLEDYGKKEPPKLVPAVTSAPPCYRPTWSEDYEWGYLVNGKNGFLRVVKKESHNNVAVYRITNDRGRIFLLNEDLNLVATLKSDGNIENEYIPENRTYEWPLTVGKTWKAAGTMKTPTGSLNLSTNFEVKDYGKVKTTGGEYNAFYIVGTSDSGARIVEIWYSPDVKQKVKSVSYTQAGLINEEFLSFTSKSIQKNVNSDVDGKLEKLNDLHKKGLITDEDFKQQKTKLLENL